MIYDCFTFFNELDLLELRLNVLNDVIDKFVIVEGTKTFTGQEKPMNFKENQERFAKFSDKIIYIEFDNFPPDKNPWIYENLQRNGIALGLVDCNDDDVIIISDLDEIVSPDAVKKAAANLNQGTPIKKFVQYNMNYYLNVIKSTEPLWFHPEICTYKNFKTCLDNIDYNYNQFVPQEVNNNTTASKIRMKEECELIPFGGWHFSFMGGAEKIIYKYQNYSHQECMQNIDSIMKNTIESINNVNSVNDSTVSKALDYSIMPQYVQENSEKYQQYISKTPKENLGKFKDVFDASEIKNKFYKYMFLRVFSLGNSRKRYKRKYFSHKEKYSIIKDYLSLNN